MSGCGRCHTCGAELGQVLDGEEWCPRCGAYRRYRDHGWAAGEASPCPSTDKERTSRHGKAA